MAKTADFWRENSNCTMKTCTGWKQNTVLYVILFAPCIFVFILYFEFSRQKSVVWAICIAV